MTKNNNTAAPECVCAECGHEQLGMDPCRRCRSRRVVLLTVVRKEFGEDWRATCFPPDACKETP